VLGNYLLVTGHGLHGLGRRPLPVPCPGPQSPQTYVSLIDLSAVNAYLTICLFVPLRLMGSTEPETAV